MYQPFVFKLDSGNFDFIDESENKKTLILTSSINLPLNSLGFHTFIHRTKNAMSITNNLQTKNEFYFVVNPFEHIISNYEDSLKKLTNIYLGITEDNPDILSRAFYKMWEILYLFGIADQPELTYAALAEGPGAFIQAVINYRQKLGSGIAKDKIFGVTIHPEKGKYTEMGKQFIGFYNKQNPGLLNIHKTVSITKAAKYKAKNNGDITQVKTIGLFKKDIEKNESFANLITADGEFDWTDSMFQEQEAYQLILGEIIAALRVQAKDGNFVLKVFETFTIPSIKLIYLLSAFYEETYVYKPFFSRTSNSEKYIICKTFKYDQKKNSTLLNKKIKILEKILDEMNSIKFVFDIFPHFDLPENYLDKFKFINIKIANPQQIIINDIITYIKENNYYGEKYHMYREKQINATKWWVNNFYPPSNNLYIKNKEELDQLMKNSLEKNIIELNNFLLTLTK
jgi:23S rRNA U2552 (ribose-2'-O)-methylase RlmE/FtsJ